MNPKERKELVEWLKKFRSRAGMKKAGYHGLYGRLRKDYTSILDEALPLTLTYWDLDKCKADALNYKTRGEWEKNSSAYKAAYKNNWLEECCEHMEVLKRPWDLDKCKADALKYKTRSEWEKNSGSAYSIASKKKWLDECCAHMEALRQMRTLESCKKDALNYKTRGEWQKNNPRVYNAARRNKWIDECCKHMKPSASAKTPIQCIETGIVYESQAEAAREMGLNAGNIGSVLKGRYKSTGGYSFKYVKGKK